MKLIKPYYEILSKPDSEEILKALESAGRTCYKSEDKITKDSSKKFIKMIIDRGHESVLEHKHLSVKFVVDRGVSHELVRHRLASFSQESTRYCNYSKDKFDNELTFIVPNWITHEFIIETLKGTDPNSEIWDEMFERDDQVDEAGWRWYQAIECTEEIYFDLLENGWTPQQARSVLPNSLKTEIVITSNLRHWREIFKQRTAKNAHPQMRDVMCPLLDEMKEKLPVIFDDINY